MQVSLSASCGGIQIQSFAGRRCPGKFPDEASMCFFIQAFDITRFADFQRTLNVQLKKDSERMIFLNITRSLRIGQ